MFNSDASPLLPLLGIWPIKDDRDLLLRSLRAKERAEIKDNNDLEATIVEIWFYIKLN